VCREIRAEYRPIQRREAQIELEWNDLQHFLDDYLYTNEDRASPPRALYVSMTSAFRKDQTVDILPLLLTKAMHPSFLCTFFDDGSDDSSVDSFMSRDQARLHAEWAAMDDLLNLKTKSWMLDIQTGRISSVVVRRHQSVCIKFARGREPEGLALWFSSQSEDPWKHQDVYERTRDRWGFHQYAFLAYEWGLELEIES
jgi:hypothetical protein